MTIERPSVPAFCVTSGEMIDWPISPDQQIRTAMWVWFNGHCKTEIAGYRDPRAGAFSELVERIVKIASPAPKEEPHG